MNPEASPQSLGNVVSLTKDLGCRADGWWWNVCHLHLGRLHVRNETEVKLKQICFVSVLFQTPAHVKRNWNKTLKQLLKCFRFVSELLRASLRWLFQRFVSHTWCAEIKQCHQWSAEIKQIYFSFVSVLFHVWAALVTVALLFSLLLITVFFGTWCHETWSRWVFVHNAAGR